MRISRNGCRNRAMFIASLQGVTKELLAIQYGLTVKRVHAILLSERHKREVNPTPAYDALRRVTGFGRRYGILTN